MLKSRPIRFAVNLCVIGALIAPVAGLGGFVQDECGDQAASGATCPGCGCCAVHHAGDRCGCCSGTQASDSTSQDSAAEGCCPEGDSSEAAMEAPQEELGVCMCGTAAPQPAVPPVDGRPASELLVQTLVLGHPSDMVCVDTGGPSSAHFQEDAAPPSLLPRDAQRRLGVWRI